MAESGETIAESRRKYWQDMEQAEKRIRQAFARTPKQTIEDVQQLLDQLKGEQPE